MANSEQSSFLHLRSVGVRIIRANCNEYVIQSLGCTNASSLQSLSSMLGILKR